MKTTEITTEVTDLHRLEFLSTLAPFGYRDIDAAIKIALECGERSEYAAEQITEYMESTDAKITDVDPVYCVLESILQYSRNEIEQQTGYDFINDNTSREIYTYGNFMCSSYDYNEESIKELKKHLKKAKVSASDFSSKTLYFLSEIGINIK